MTTSSPMITWRMTTGTVIGCEGDVAMSGTMDDVARCGGDTSGTVNRPHTRPEPATVHHRSGLHVLTGNTGVSAVGHVDNDPVVATALAKKTAPCSAEGSQIPRRCGHPRIVWSEGSDGVCDDVKKEPDV